MEKIYMTRHISENLDLRLLTSVMALLNNKILKTREEDLDYLQIFEIKNNKLIHSQEQPKQSKEYNLVGNFKDTKVWAVRGEDERVGEYWTIMFPEDY